MALDLIDFGDGVDTESGDNGFEGGTKINAMFTELYQITDGAGNVTAADGDFTGTLDVADNAYFAKRVAIGGNTDNSFTAISPLLDIYDGNTDASAPTVVGFIGKATYGGTLAPLNLGGAIGGTVTAYNDSVHDIDTLIGLEVGVETTAGGTGAVPTATGLIVKEPVFDGTHAATYTGINLISDLQSGPGDTTDYTLWTGLNIGLMSQDCNEGYGIKLAGVWGDIGVSHGIWLTHDHANHAGTGYGADILFGAGKDASIYYDGTDLAIDSALAGSGTIDFVSQTATAIGGLSLSEYITVKVGGVSKRIALVA